MTGFTFDAVARQIGRRRALQALGAAAVATVSGISPTEAKRNGGNKRKNRKKKRKQQRIEEQSLALCAGQVAQCNAVIAQSCGEGEGCQAQQRCCELLATCDFAGVIICLNQTAV
ncbi:MAG: hypothetical protein KC442_09165 [Thermomicrobiales bacterium]|nr:hypothetical protein [Thermomicrobiales bacterium]